MTDGESTGRLAPVRPRVRSPFSGEVVLLEDEIEDLLREGRRRVVYLHGPADWGKHTALDRLEARLGVTCPLAVREERELERHTVPEEGVILFATTRARSWFPTRWIGFEMAPWGLDEALEYLQTAHPSQARGVMSRLVSAGDADHLAGVPRLWRDVLDALVEDASLEGVRAALLACVAGEASRLPDRRRLALWCLDRFGALAEGRSTAWMLPSELLATSLLVRSDRARLDWLLVELLRDLRAGDLDLLSAMVVPAPALIPELGRHIADQPQLREVVRDLLRSPDTRHRAVPASLLHVHDSGWIHDVIPVPPGAPPLDLSHALLPGLVAREARLGGVRLDHAQLAGADLLGADLDGASLVGTNLARADLSGARLARVRAESAVLCGASLAQAAAKAADLTRADLRDADLQGACLDGAVCEHTDLREVRAAHATFECARLGFAHFAGADLRGASLDGANLLSADLRTVTLRGASFQGACLANARLDGLDLTGAPMRAANLLRADLTGTRLTGADLHGAILDEARMAYVDLEGADLRRARIRKAVFHLGSSRSGLVFSDLASEGTRTGFYTDDDQHLDAKPIEEIRKANFRGADLRGAKVLETDWYLVDLREARYDERQRDHFRACRAILEDAAA